MTSPFNPYQPPASDDLVPNEVKGAGPSYVATRGQRFAAALIDGMIGLAVIAPMQWKFGVFEKLFAKQKLTLTETAIWGVAGFVLWCLEHGYFLAKNSQTIGKRLIGIRVENVNGGRAEIKKLIFMRYLPVALVANIPIVGGVVTMLDAIFIFRRDSRCLHDHIAGTVVVKAPLSS